MRTVHVDSQLLARLRAEGRAGYPEEVCGFLLAAADEVEGPQRTIRAAEPAPNSSASERRRRFVILPEELRQAERRADARGQVVAGFYHSHPDHPAIPSAYDAEHAWPWYTYLVLSVDQLGAGETGAFELEATIRRFDSCRLAVRAPAEAPGGVAAAAGR